MSKAILIRALLLLGLAAVAAVPTLAQTAKTPGAKAPEAKAPAKAADTKKPARPVVKDLAERLRSPYEADRPIADKLRSPRETLKTLYFAVVTYDLFPKIIDDAVACLDLDAMQMKFTPEDAALLALDLEQILQSLSLPLANVPDQATGDSFVLHDLGNFKLSMRRGDDGGWRFDAETLTRLPAMRRAAREAGQKRSADIATLREGFTDPRATLRQFISDSANGDYYAAARALDLSLLSDEQRREQGPTLAQQLAFIQQRRGFMFRQEVPDQADGPAYTWHADGNGRMTLDRVKGADGKDAWLFTKQTVRSIPRMYKAIQDREPDGRYLRLGMVIPPRSAGPAEAARKRPDDIPAHLGSPRALLKGFFRIMDAAESNDSRLADALEYLDLEAVPASDRASQGGKLASKLEAVLRKIPLDLSGIPDMWNAPPQILGEAQGVRVEILRGRDGCWRFSKATVGRVPEMFGKLAGKTRLETGAAAQGDSPRDAVVTFLTATARRDFDSAARCLNLDDIHSSAREELGPVLAFKLRYIFDRIGRIYVQEIPDTPDGPRFVLYRGKLGRVALDRRGEGADKGAWQFTPDTVDRIESMFAARLNMPLEAGDDDPDEANVEVDLIETPGVWLRLHLPTWARKRLGMLDRYQWLGVVLACLLSWAGALVAMVLVSRGITWVLHRSGSALSASFIASTLRPFTWLTAVWFFYVLLRGLDLPCAVASNVFAAHKFLLAALFGWLGVRLIDLSMAIYTNSELLRPHRSLSDMIVPVSMRIGKTVVVLVVATFMIYQVGQIDLLTRFLTGLGVAGLAASLAAQDAMKSFFGTLLLIGERAFKIGDRIIVGNQEGVVEQVGFRATRLRTGEDSLLTIPNAVIAAAAIDNMGARSSTRYSTKIQISPATPADRIADFRDQLRAWLVEQPLVNRDKVDVHIHQLTDSGVELSLSLFLTTRTGSEETRFREAITCQILALAGELGVDIAPFGKVPRLVSEDNAQAA